MRKFDQLTNEQKENLLYCCAWISWLDVQKQIIHPGMQLTSALTYGEKYEIKESDFAAVETVFPTQGEPKPPKK